MSKFSRRTGRIIPLTGPDLDRIAVADADLLETNEIHTTDDHNRFFFNNYVIGPVWHGEVENEAYMLNLHDNKDRGCFPGDECYREDRKTVWRCIGGNGTEDTEWIEVGRFSPLMSEGDLLFADSNIAETRLPIGTKRQVLGVDPVGGKIPAWVPDSPISKQGSLVIGDVSGNPEEFEIGDPGFVLAVNSKGTSLEYVNDLARKGSIVDSGLTVSKTEVLLGNWDDTNGKIQEIELGNYLEFNGINGKLQVQGLIPLDSVITNPNILEMVGATLPNYRDGKVLGRGSDDLGDIQSLEVIPPLHVYDAPLDGPRIQLQYNSSQFEAVAGAVPTTDGYELNLKLVPPTKGGTGLTTYAKGDTLYASGANTLAVLSIGTKGQVYTVSASGIPEWASGGAGDVVGPSSSVDSRLALFDSTTGKLLKQSSNITESGGVLTSGTLIGLAAGGTNQNVTLKPSGTGVILLDVNSPIFENDTSKAGSSFSEFPRFRPKSGQNANGGLVISPRGTGTDSYIILAGSENVTTTDIDYMAFGGGFSGAISGSWNFGALKLANATGTGRDISFVISNSGGRTEILRLGSGGLIQFRQDNPILEYNIPGSGSVVQEALIVRPLTSNKNGRLIVTPSLSNTESSITCFASGTPNTTDAQQCIMGGGTGGIPSGNWGISSSCFANATKDSRPFSVVVSNSTDGRIETFRALINGGIWLGKQSALSTGATGGFVFVPTCAGTPTGTPASAPTGLAPIIIDTTNHRFYFYSGGSWRNAGP